jgi:hypothetical protein
MRTPSQILISELEALLVAAVGLSADIYFDCEKFRLLQNSLIDF